MAVRLFLLFISLVALTEHVFSQEKVVRPKKGIITFFSETSDLSLSYQHIFRDSIIVSSQKIQGIWAHDLINTNKSTYTSVDDSTTLVLESDPIKYEYSFENNPKVVEYRNEYKIISGYKCFKVVYEQLLDSTTIRDKNITPPEIGYTIKKEFWVTDKIKTMFNPVCREKVILEKYYPLEIHYSDTLYPNITLTYKLKSISISE